MAFYGAVDGPDEKDERIAALEAELVCTKRRLSRATEEYRIQNNYKHAAISRAEKAEAERDAARKQDAYHKERLEVALRREHNFQADNARMREALQWFPISTAPKDETHILAWDGNQNFNVSPPTVVHWFEDGFYTSVNELAPEHPYNATVWTSLHEESARAALAQPEQGGE